MSYLIERKLVGFPVESKIAQHWISVGLESTLGQTEATQLEAQNSPPYWGSDSKFKT